MMKTPKKCKFQKSATRRATKRAGRERLTEFRERREGMPEITRTKTSGTRTRPSGVKDARWGWREAACRQPSWKEEWEERKSGRLRTSVLSNLILMRTKADEWESGKNLPTKKANKITKNKTSKNNNCSTYKMRQRKTKNNKVQNRTVSCVELPVVPRRRNKKHVPTSECSSTAESTTGKVFATFLVVFCCCASRQDYGLRQKIGSTISRDTEWNNMRTYTRAVD